MTTETLDRLRARLDPVADSACQGDAAVLIALTREPEPQLILTVRAAHMSAHPGEVAFPGGKRDPADRSLAETALRETEEEIALPPAQVEVIGCGRQRRSRFGLRVVPFVGVVAPDVVLAPNPAELASVFRAPLAYFLERDNLRIDVISHEGRVRDLPWYPWGETRVWGLTAVILTDLLNTAFDFGVQIRR